MSAEKEWKVPEELVRINDECVGAEKARDAAVKGYFKFQVRNASLLGAIAEKKRREFWEGVYALYPELRGKAISYYQEQYVIRLSVISSDAPEAP